MRRAHRTYQGAAPTVAPTSDVIGCSGKRQYPKFSDAARVAVLVRRNKDGERTAAYKCKHCAKYHIGGRGDSMSRWRATDPPKF